LLVTAQQAGGPQRRRHTSVHTSGGQALGRTTRRTTSTLVSSRPAHARRMRGPHQRHEAARWLGALCLSRLRWHATLGRLGRGEQQPLGPDHGRPLLAHTTIKSIATTVKLQTNNFAPEISLGAPGACFQLLDLLSNAT